MKDIADPAAAFVPETDPETVPAPPPAARSTAAPKRGSRPAAARLPALDGLRGFAILLVLLDHASDVDLRMFAAANMNRAGKYGVYLFFVLSAFLLTHLFLQRPAGELHRARTWLNYFLRRFLRIFPPYALVLFCLIPLHRLVPSQVIDHLLMRDGTKQFWTIPVEVKYYLILPLVVLAARWLAAKDWRRGILATAGLLAVSGAILHFEKVWSLTDTVYLSQNLEPFVLGSAAAFAHGALTRHARAISRFAGLIEIAAIVALGASIVRIPFIFNHVFSMEKAVHKFGADSTVCGLLWTVVLLGMLHGRGWVRGLMEWRPLRGLGLISYSAYLWHEKFLNDVDNMPLPHPVRLLIFLALIIGVATACYLLIEKPLSRIRLKGCS